MSIHHLETLKSLPPGYDPVFNNANAAQYTNENSHIKIKPMRLSKGFDRASYLEADSSSPREEGSFLPKGNSVGSLD